LVISIAINIINIQNDPYTCMIYNRFSNLSKYLSMLNVDNNRNIQELTNILLKFKLLQILG